MGINRRWFALAVVAVVAMVTGVTLVVVNQDGPAGAAGRVGSLVTEPDTLATSTSRPGPPTSTPTSTTPTPTPTHTTPVLLPDVQSLPASDPSIEIVDGARRLRFSATLANAGSGPLELVPDDAQACPPDQRHALQRTYVDADGDDGFSRAVDTATESRPAGCMLDHPEHDHWHFDAMARYALTSVGATLSVAERTKVSFCLRDNITVPAASAPAAGQPDHYGECEDRLAVQGISPGWADVYTAELADQHLDLPPDLADGTYCLHTEADPFRLLREVDSTDNAAAVAIQITGTTAVLDSDTTCRPLPPLDEPQA